MIKNGLISFISLFFAVGCTSTLRDIPPFMSGSCLVNSCYPGRLEEWKALSTGEKIDFLKWVRERRSIEDWHTVTRFFRGLDLDEQVLIKRILGDDDKGVFPTILLVDLKFMCKKSGDDYSKFISAMETRLQYTKINSELHEDLLTYKGMLQEPEEDPEFGCNVLEGNYNEIVQEIVPNTTGCSKKELDEAAECAKRFSMRKMVESN